MVKRCMTTNLNECMKDPLHPCCKRFTINRFFPIGPYVEPSLTENWISNLFQFAGKNPVSFVWVKTLFIFSVVVILSTLWGLLGKL